MIGQCKSVVRHLRIKITSRTNNRSFISFKYTTTGDELWKRTVTQVFEGPCELTDYIEFNLTGEKRRVKEIKWRAKVADSAEKFDGVTIWQTRETTLVDIEQVRETQLKNDGWNDRKD